MLFYVQMYKSYVIVHDANGQPKEQLKPKETTLKFDDVELNTTDASSWWCPLRWVIPFLFLFLVAGLGPWYHDCGHPDNCVTQRNYGLYCDDYCIYGHYGLGHSSGLLFMVLLFALFWFSSSCNRTW